MECSLQLTAQRKKAKDRLAVWTPNETIAEPVAFTLLFTSSHHRLFRSALSPARDLFTLYSSAQGWSASLSAYRILTVRLPLSKEILPASRIAVVCIVVPMVASSPCSTAQHSSGGGPGALGAPQGSPQGSPQGASQGSPQGSTAGAQKFDFFRFVVIFQAATMSKILPKGPGTSPKAPETIFKNQIFIIFSRLF